MSSDDLKDLITVSREFGTDDFAVGGGGNTSVKDDEVLLVKKSGTQLATADSDTFLSLDRRMLDDLMSGSYPDDSEAREALVKRNLLRTMREPDRGGRPSVEASIHNLISYKFVVHTHPWKANALTCSRNGRRILAGEFSDSLYVPYCDPGYTLGSTLRKRLSAATRTLGREPNVIFLENHGLIVSANTIAEVRRIMRSTLKRCESHITMPPSAALRGKAPASKPEDARLVSAIRSALSTTVRKTTHILRGPLVDEFIKDRAAFLPVSLPLTPDQIVYCRSHPLYLGPGTGDRAGTFASALAAHRKKYGEDPRVVAVHGLGVVSAGDSASEARLVGTVFADFLKIVHATGKTGGPRHLGSRSRRFIEEWEVEKYRRSLVEGVGGSRTAVVTGGAQGIGEGIVRSLFDEGYNVVVADLNERGGRKLAREIEGDGGRKNGVQFVKTDVSREQSVAALLEQTVMAFGGCDLYISNAGVLRAGGLEEIDSATFDFMTDVNYKGYFIGAKYASAIMKHQHDYAPHLMSDIIQVNSKSGLAGSNRNFSYAGGKFGGIGLTQSFALELIPYGIKVNSVCPGNFLDGPLWSDPERGLFVQYLKAGKVRGARSTADVRQAYEQKVPAGRGCTIPDVMRAIRYIVEQEYETGQAVPVTGGQVMLK